MGAALALKQALNEMKLPGTVRYYGCPAEELLAGKVYMAREGLFDDLDVAITWHPGSMNTVRLSSGTALNSAKFQFFGKTAHAAGDPHNGRSALDAVELMNVGANYLREHVIKDATIHYVITSGGDQPNVVPAFAEVWYFVRAPRRDQVEHIYERLVNVAKGAALMTETTFEIDFLTGCYNVLLNEVLADVMWDCLQKVGPPAFDDKDIEFGKKLAGTFDKAQMENMYKSPPLPRVSGTEATGDPYIPLAAPGQEQFRRWLHRRRRCELDSAYGPNVGRDCTHWLSGAFVAILRIGGKLHRSQGNDHGCKDHGLVWAGAC